MSAAKDKFTTADKAVYADEKTVNFVRSGLVLKIISAEIVADGTAKARVLFTDLRGLWLDRLGIQARGNVGASFVLASIPRGETTYKSYATRAQTSPITRVSATQASADTGGTWTQRTFTPSVPKPQRDMTGRPLTQSPCTPIGTSRNSI